MSDLRDDLLIRPFSRRALVKGAAVLGFGIPLLSSVLAACGGDDDDDDDDDPGAGTTPTADGAGATSTGVTVNANLTPTPAAGGATATTAAATQPTGAAGGSVTFARSEDSTSLDPVLWHNPDIWPFMNVYDQLIKVDESGTTLAPGLAETWEVSDDSLTYTFNIRSGVMFSDASPLTVEDVVWSIERAKADTNGGWNFTLMQVDEITAPDDATVVITLTGPWAPFLSDISMFNSSIVSKAFADSVGVDALAEQAMGTGPFAVKEWKKAEYVLLVKNENYWEEGLPLVDEVKILLVPDTNSQLVQLQGGQIDGMIGQGDVPFNRVPDLEVDTNLQVIKFLSTYVNFVVLNVRNAPLDDPKVRQALNYATDKQALIETVLFGNAEISNSFMPNGALYWAEDQEAYPLDVEMANQLMSESNSPDGISISLTIPAGNSLSTQIATALKDMWSTINVELAIEQLDPSVLRDNFLDNKFESVLSGWTNDIIDPDELVSYTILPESNENYHSGWINQEAIDLAHQAQVELDPEKRRELYAEIQQIHKDDGPFVYLYVIPYIDALNKKVTGFFHHPMGQYVFANMSVTQ